MIKNVHFNVDIYTHKKSLQTQTGLEGKLSIGREETAHQKAPFFYSVGLFFVFRFIFGFNLNL